MLSNKQAAMAKKSGYVIEIDGVENTVFLSIPYNIFEDIVASPKKPTYIMQYEEGLLIGSHEGTRWPTIPVSKTIATAYIYGLADKLANQKNTVVDVKNGPEKIFKLSKKEKANVEVLKDLIKVQDTNPEEEVQPSDIYWDFKILKGLLNA